EILSLVVHDLKNPISTMMVNANLLCAIRELPEAVHESSQDIADAAAAMNRMVTNLVELGRSDTSAPAPRWSRVDVTALAETVCAARRRQAQDRNQSIEIASALDGDAIDAERDLLGGLVENLLDNALRYSPARSVIRLELAATGDG